MAENIDFRVKNGLVVTTTATILGTTNSTSTTTGALQVRGGIGVAGDIYTGGEKLTFRGNASQNATYGPAFEFLDYGGDVPNRLNINKGAMLRFGRPDYPNDIITINALLDDGNLNVPNPDPWLIVSSKGSVFIGVHNSANHGEFFRFLPDFDNARTYAEFPRLNIIGTDNSTSTTTGALQVAGGVGIQRDVWIGGSLNVTGSITANLTGASSQLQTRAQTLNANYFPVFVDSNNSSAAAESLFTTSSFTVNPSTGEVDILSTLNSTNTTTGALVISGGVGIGRDVWIGEKLNVNFGGSLLVGSAINAISGASGTAITGLGAPHSQSDTQAKIGLQGLSQTTGSYSVGVFGSVSNDFGSASAYVGSYISNEFWALWTTDKIKIKNNTNSTSTTTGALIVDGGAGIGRDAWVGGTLSTNGLRQIQTTISASTTTVLDLSVANNFYIVLDKNVTFSLTNISSNIGASGYVIMQQNATGGWVFTKASEMKTPGGRTIVQSTTSNSLSLITYYVVSTNTVVINYIGNFS